MKHLLIFSLVVMFAFPLYAQEGVPVVVTTQPLPRGTVLTEEVLLNSVEIQFWSAELVPQTAIQDTQVLVGQVVKLDLAVRTPILAGAIATQTPDAARIGSDSALLLPQDYLGVPLVVDNLFYAPPDLAELDCLLVSAIVDFGEDQVVEYVLTDQAIVIENAYSLAATVVVVAMPPQAGITALWLQDHHIPLALVYSTTNVNCL